MAEERFKRGNADLSDQFDSVLMYDDIEKIRDMEQEMEKDQSGKLGSAGLMAFLAGASLIALTFASTLISPDLMEFLRTIALPVIGFGALGYGLIKTLRMVFRQKLLNFPALNVYRKTRSNPTGAAEATAGTFNQNQARYQRRYAQQQQGRKTLRRSRTNRVFSGVAGGIAEMTGVSAALVRFAFIAAMPFAAPAPIFLYLLLSIVLPANYDDIPSRGRREGSREREE
ncbi:MAG: PspC domain-containing protein [Bacteroidia bacterium]|nr:PspC domain-containing protein [Bacteroidia bacterium]